MRREEGGRKKRKKLQKLRFANVSSLEENVHMEWGGQKKHDKWEKCNKAHPKVCNKLLAHGPNGKQGCAGKDCDKYHPKMCYSSLNTKVCSKDKCTYWHCKGTSFAPESRERYEAPSRHSMNHYPLLPERRGRSPVRREQEPRHRPREEPVRGEREERRKGEMWRVERRREEVDLEWRRRDR
jgi:hypothetical protein